MTLSDFAKLYDPVNHLTCHYVPVNNATVDVVESVRDMFITSMNNYGYVGFSRKIDNMFHERSTYVFLTNAANIKIMTSRVTPRPLGAMVPFEMGIRDDGGSYSLGDEEQVVDINTYTHARGFQWALPLLAAGFGYYVKKKCNAKKAYCLYDVENLRIEKAYMSIDFVLSTKFPEPIHFPEFCLKKEGKKKPVRWRVMEWDGETIERHARTAMEKYELINNI